MRVDDWSEADEAERRGLLARPHPAAGAALAADVAAILAEVRSDGWEALVRIAVRIDGAPPERVEVAPHAERARRDLPEATRAAIELARDNIERFHRRTRPRDVSVETRPGMTGEKRWVPWSSAGLYVPGGTAPLFSTLLMLAVPARAAGVERLSVVTPPREGGGLDPAVALAAEMVGVDHLWTVGGAQAIAALAFGAGEIEAVDRICGPGNAWVATAKAQVAALPGGPGIDLPAGPSELMVLADGDADPARVAADLLSQAEHDADAQAILVSPSDRLIDRVGQEIAAQMQSIGGDFAPVRAIRCASLDEAVAIANRYGAEHLALALEDARAASLARRIVNAGAIFVGGAAAESFGDYLAGSSHVLPTGGAARFTGGVSTTTFMKAIGVQRIDREAAARLAPAAAALARLEGLEAHARAAELRAAMVDEPAP